MLQESIWRKVLHGTTNYFLRVDTSITGYTGLLLGGRTILHDIANGSPRVDCSQEPVSPGTLGYC